MTKESINAIYDLETTGFEAGRDSETGGVGSITQIASVLSNENLEIIEGTTKNISVKPRIDSRPTVGAIEITGINLMQMLHEGVNEYEAINGFRKDITYNDYDLPTVIAGYNNFSFDDNWVSAILYRNGFDPYEHTYKAYNSEGDNNSRLDIFAHIISVAYALRPEIMEWAKREDGSDSLKLEDLSTANGIIHENAHDAESDVIATVGLAKIVKDNLNGLFEEAHRLRNKKFAKERIENSISDLTPLVNVSSLNGKANKFTSIVLPIVSSMDTPDQYYLLNLERDIEDLLDRDPKEIIDEMYTPGEKSPIETVWANKANLFNTNILREQDVERIGLDMEKINKNIQYIINNEEKLKELSKALSNKPSIMPKGSETYDKKGMISGLPSSPKGFFSYKAKGIFKNFHKAVTIAKKDNKFIDFNVTEEANKTDDKHRVFDILLRSKWLSAQNVDFNSYKIKDLNDYIELKELNKYLKSICAPQGDDKYKEYQLIDERINSGELSERQIDALKGMKDFLEYVESQQASLDKEIRRNAEIYEEKVIESKSYKILEKIFDYDSKNIDTIKKDSRDNNTSLQP